MNLVEEPLNIALLTYRGHPHVGGQGVYVHYLAGSLADLGHNVTVFSGPPYPDLPMHIPLVRVPSLDLYEPDDPFRRPARSEFRDWIDVAEYALMCTAAFPEPLTFSLRAARELASRPPYDVVHDNQCLGYGLMRIARRGVPVVATVHHPISIDRRLDLARATRSKKKLSLRRWYSFTRMQGRVARRLPRVITVSDSARADVAEEFGVELNRIGVVHNGVDTDLFRPLGTERVSGRVIAIASSDGHMKGIDTLLEAVAKLNTEREVELTIVGKGGSTPMTRAAIARYGIADAVRIEGRIETLRLIELYAEAQVAVVPSRYEGFSLPAIEAMSCGVPLVCTTGGALPEVVGRDGDAALLVPPGDPGALAGAIGRLLDDSSSRTSLATAGRRRAEQLFTWKTTARKTVDQYRMAMLGC